ncbi:unnamed protein product, partial [Prorocentrum cordatum]
MRGKKTPGSTSFVDYTKLNYVHISQQVMPAFTPVFNETPSAISSSHRAQMAAHIQTSQSNSMQELAKYKAEGGARMAAIKTSLESLHAMRLYRAPSGADANGALQQGPWAAFGASNKTAQLEKDVENSATCIADMKGSGVSGSSSASLVGSTSGSPPGGAPVNETERSVGTFPRCTAGSQKTAHREQPKGVSKSCGFVFGSAASARAASEFMSDKQARWQGP